MNSVQKLRQISRELDPRVSSIWTKQNSMHMFDQSLSVKKNAAVFRGILSNQMDGMPIPKYAAIPSQELEFAR